MSPLEQCTYTVSNNIIDQKRQTSTDLTGKFPITSNMENKYLFVLYEYDINSIFIRTMKAR